MDAFYEPLLIGPVLYDFFEMGPRRVWKTFRACLRDRIEEKLPRLSMPTLLIRGKLDPIARPGWLERMSSLLPNARTHTVPGAPHAIAFSAPGEVARLAEAFCLSIRKNDPPACAV